MLRLSRWLGLFLHTAARSCAPVALACVACLSAACLVTNKVDYDTPNTPAQLMKLDDAGFRIVPTTADPECAEQGSEGMERWLRFAVAVRDPDAQDALQARVIINGMSVDTNDVDGTGSVQREPFEYCAKKDDLDLKCVHVEILVTRKFSDTDGQDDPYGTSDPLDVGYTDWWLVGPTDKFAEVGVSSCQNLEPPR